MVYRLILIICFAFTSVQAFAQPKMIDEIVAVVGDNYILRTDIEKEFETLREQMGADQVHDSMRIDILDQLISKKLLLYQAQLDSIVIPDEQVNAQMDQKMAYILGHFGGDEKKLEQYLKMTIPEFKAKTKPKLREQILIQQMESQIINQVKVTPSEVRKYFNKIPKDSLPPVPSEVEVAQIVKRPQVSEFAKKYAKIQAEELRQRLLEGDDFCRLADLYSNDPGSSGKCGELGFFQRGKMVPEFEAAAFRMKEDSISGVVESQFGFHILQVLDRRGESLNVRHILIQPKLVQTDIQNAYNILDSLRTAIFEGKASFEEVAKEYSDEENTAARGGLLADYRNGNSKIPVGQLDKQVYLAIKDLKVGEMTDPQAVMTEDQKQVYVIYKLISETQPHMPSLATDYLRIQEAALNEKKGRALETWVEKSKEKYYIHINQRFAEEPELQHWVRKENGTNR